MSLSRNPVVILGMFRSGTSSVALALSKLGVYLGEPDDFYPPDENNEFGYFEIQDLINLNSRFLAIYRMAFNAVRPLPETWLELPQSEFVVAELMSYLSRKFSGKARWGVKQPMIGPLFPIYQEAFRRLGLNPHYVLCVRNPIEVADSESKWAYNAQNRRAHAPLGERCFGVWLHYTLYPLAFSGGAQRTVVTYQDFIEAPRRFLESITGAIAGWDPTENQWFGAAESVEVKLRRSRSSDDELGHLPDVVRQTYDICQRAASTQSDYRNGRFDPEIKVLWTEVAKLRDLFAEAKPPPGSLIVAYRDGNEMRQIDSQFMPEENWQTVRITIPAPQESVIAAALYGLPAIVWVRKALWRFDGRQAEAQIDVGRYGLKSRSGPYLNLQLVPEPQQLVLQTPRGKGPFELEIELYLETGFFVATLAVNRLLAGQR